MSTDNSNGEITIAARVSKVLYGKILQRQRKAKRLTGIDTSVSAVVRAMIEEAASNDEPRKKKMKTRGAAA